jgi:hypothetical protein
MDSARIIQESQARFVWFSPAVGPAVFAGVVGKVVTAPEVTGASGPVEGNSPMLTMSVAAKPQAE